MTFDATIIIFLGTVCFVSLGVTAGMIFARREEKRLELKRKAKKAKKQAKKALKKAKKNGSRKEG